MGAVRRQLRRRCLRRGRCLRRQRRLRCGCLRPGNEWRVCLGGFSRKGTTIPFPPFLNLPSRALVRFARTQALSLFLPSLFHLISPSPIVCCWQRGWCRETPCLPSKCSSWWAHIIYASLGFLFFSVDI